MWNENMKGNTEQKEAETFFVGNNQRRTTLKTRDSYPARVEPYLFFVLILLEFRIELWVTIVGAWSLHRTETEHL